MYDKIIGILADKIVLSLVLVFIITQLLKFFTSSYQKGRINLKKFFEGGGMPSSHSSIVAALTTSIFLNEGLSTLSVVVFIFALIVVRDAFGVRRHAGIHAKLLNVLAKDSKFRKKITTKIGNKKLQEHIGHTRVEVAAGVVLGIVVSIVIWLI